MRMIDFHCDVLSKLLEDREAEFSGPGAASLDVTYERLQEAGTALQVFAVYIPARLSGRIEPILESIDLFYEKVVSCGRMQPVRNRQELDACLNEGRIGAMLSLEGVDGLNGSLPALRLLHRLGVRAAGLTWNHANWAADGIMEPRGGGLTTEGRRLVEEMLKLDMLLDVSHLSERGFWELISLSPKPLIASHSNAREICGHPRNLTDDQIAALIGGGGMIGLTYVPWFITSGEEAAIDDLLRHVDHICALGGAANLMLGSDFDGIDRHAAGLSHPGELYRLREAMMKRYGEELTEAIIGGNALRFLRSRLPSA
jgi:Zn-dependent dipeptidase, microsomal dipeptidase homolog